MSPPSLDTLPSDLLVEFLKCLDWPDVLRLRQVSRSLYLASKEKAVWVAISKNHENETFPPSHFFEKRMTELSASELEEAVLRPRKVDAAWSKSVEFSYRTANVRPGDVITEVLPGGRWALATNDSGEVLCYDLESCSGLLLHYLLGDVPPFPTPRVQPRIAVDHFTLKSPCLTFHLAIYHTCTVLPVEENATPANLTAYTGHLQILRVGPEFDERGQIVKLSSTRLSCFNPGPEILWEMQLSGQYICYTTRNMYRMVEWERANNLTQAFERRWIPPNPELLCLLPHGLAVCFRPVRSSSVSMLDLTSVPLHTDGQAPIGNIRAPIDPLWTEPINFKLMSSTGPCKIPGAGCDKAPHFLLAANPLPLLPGTRFRTGPMIDVDIDTTTPYLTFHLAIYFTRSDLDALPDGGIGGHHPILQIWRVTPSFDASGRIDRLIPHHLRTFHRAEHGSFDFLQICGPCIGIREGSQSVVFDWVNTPADVDASLPLSWDEENNFQYAIPSGNLHALLPGRRVLLHNSDKISIGYIPPVVPPSCRDDMPSVPILWTGKIPFELWCRNAGIFGPFFGPDADVFAFTTHPGAPSALLTVPNDFTIADDPHKPRIDSVASLAQPFGLTFYSAWSPRRFAFLHWPDRDTKRFLLRRGRVPYPPSPPMVDIPYDDFDIPLEHLAIDEYKYLGDITFDECSSLIGVEVDTSAQASVLLFEPVFH